jgi:thioredoxin 1
MKVFAFILTLLLVISMFACKGRTEQDMETDNAEMEVLDSVASEPLAEPVSVEETKMEEAKAVPTEKKEVAKAVEPTQPPKESYKVYFLEIGSVNCIPCRMMQPIMKEIEEDYKGIVKVEFYDLMEPAGRSIGQQYSIRVMPTQVFLDENKREFSRHEGFYPKDELSKMLDKYLASLK